MDRDDSRYDYDEGAGWSTDLKARTAQSRYEKAGDYSRVNPGLGSNARGDSKRHREWECDQPNGYACNQV